MAFAVCGWDGADPLFGRMGRLLAGRPGVHPARRDTIFARQFPGIHGSTFIADVGGRTPRCY